MARAFIDTSGYFAFTDATSFVIMERLHISQAFAFDYHFAQYGFELLA